MEDSEGNPVFSANQVASLRLSIAALVLLPFSARAIYKITAKNPDRNTQRVEKQDWKWLMLVAVFGSGFPAFLFTTSETFLSSSVAGILNSLTPLFTLILGILLFSKPSHPRQVVGILVGLAGAICLISINGLGDSENWWYSLLVVIATMCYGLSVNTIGYRLSHLNPIEISAITLLIVGIPCGFIALGSGAVDVLTEHPSGPAAFGYICILAVAGTAFAVIGYFWLAQRASVLFASSVAYVMQLVAVGWGVYAGEKLTVFHLLCGLVILAGVYLVNRGAAKKL